MTLARDITTLGSVAAMPAQE